MRYETNEISLLISRFSFLVSHFSFLSRSNDMNNDKIALQLYTLRELTSQDMLGTLREVAGQGYKAVEFAGFSGVPVETIRAELDTLGVRAISLHVGVGDLQTRREEVLRDAKTLGCSYVVVAYV